MVVARVKVPKQVGRYQLGYELSPSYLGPLWAARVEGNDAAGLVMLRLVSLARLDADTRVRLLEAAWQAMEVSDDRIASVTDVVASDGELSVVCDYAEGVTFRALSGLISVKRKPMSVSVALRFIVDLADGVVALHRAMAELGDEAVPLFGGVSADSVLMGADGRATLLDVAIASAASSVESLGGTPERIVYAAPEQLEATPSADLRTDIFSLGILAWEMLTSRRLFVGADRAVAQKVLAAKVPRLDDPTRKGDFEIPKPLIAVVMRALAREPAARFESAEAFRAALDTVDAAPATPQEAGEYVVSMAEGPFARARDALSLPPRPPKPAETRTPPRATVEPRPLAPRAAEPKPVESRAPRAIEATLASARPRVEARPAAAPRAATDAKSGVANPRPSRETKPALPARPSGEHKAVARPSVDPKPVAVARPSIDPAPAAPAMPVPAPLPARSGADAPVQTSKRVSIEPKAPDRTARASIEPGSGGGWRALEPPSNHSVPPAKVRPRQVTMIGLPPPADLREPAPVMDLASTLPGGTPTPVVAAAPASEPPPERVVNAKLLASWAPSKYAFPEASAGAATEPEPARLATPDTLPPPSSSDEPTGQYTREHLKQLAELRPAPGFADDTERAPAVVPAKPAPREREVALPRLVSLQPTPRPLSEIHTERPPPPEPEYTPAASPAALRAPAPMQYSPPAPAAAPPEARVPAPLPPAPAHAAAVHVGAPPAARLEAGFPGAAPAAFTPATRSLPAGVNNAAFAPTAPPPRATERPAFSRPPPATAPASYVPSQVTPPLIHDPRANRLAPAAAASPHFTRGVVLGVVVSLGLVALSASVALFFMRGHGAPAQEDDRGAASEHRNAPARSESLPVPAERAVPAQTATAAPAPTTPTVAATAVPVESATAAAPSAPPTPEMTRPAVPATAETRAAAPHAARPSHKATKKRKFVPEDI
jgi:hypothetical protein